MKWFSDTECGPFGLLVTLIVVVLFWFAVYICTPKCYFAKVAGKTDVGHYEFKKQCKNQEEAGRAVGDLLAMLPVRSTITAVSISEETRGWFCEK